MEDEMEKKKNKDLLLKTEDGMATSRDTISSILSQRNLNEEEQAAEWRKGEREREEERKR